MDITAELDIAAKVHDDMTGKPNTMANSIRRGIAEIERLRAARDEQRDGRLLALERAVAAERERDALLARAERAEGRIESSAVVRLHYNGASREWSLSREEPIYLPDYDGKCVALVVLND